MQRKCQVLNTMRVEPLGFIVGSDVDKRARGIKKDSQFWSEKPERVWSSLRWESGRHSCGFYEISKLSNCVSEILTMSRLIFTLDLLY